MIHRSSLRILKQDAENGIDLDILKDNSVVNREKFFEAKYSQKKSPLKNMFTDFTSNILLHCPKKFSFVLFA